MIISNYTNVPISTVNSGTENAKIKQEKNSLTHRAHKVGQTSDKDGINEQRIQDEDKNAHHQSRSYESDEFVMDDELESLESVDHKEKSIPDWVMDSPVVTGQEPVLGLSYYDEPVVANMRFWSSSVVAYFSDDIKHTSTTEASAFKKRKERLDKKLLQDLPDENIDNLYIYSSEPSEEISELDAMKHQRWLAEQAKEHPENILKSKHEVDHQANEISDESFVNKRATHFETSI